MIMKLSSIVLLLLLLCCCKNEKTSSLVSLDVLSPDGTELTNLSEIASDIQYIPLETTPKALMRFLMYLKATEDKYYFNTVQELLCFDKSGKFLYKLDSQGRGPEEYTYISDYDLLPGKKLVILLASVSRKLLFYNETDSGFKYLRKLDVKVPPRYCDFISDKDNILMSYTSADGENKYQCVVINQNGDTLFKRPNYYKFTRNSKVVMGFGIDNVINRTNETLRIKGFLTDTMFTITNDYKFVPYLILNTAGYGITADFLANVPLTDPNSGSPAAKFLMLSEILEVDRYLLFRYYYEKVSKWNVYDKKSGVTSYFDTKKLLQDDISGGINIEPKFCYDGVLYSWTDALTFKKIMSEKANQSTDLKNQKRAEEVQRLAETIKEDDNHILIVITPKK